MPDSILFITISELVNKSGFHAYTTIAKSKSHETLRHDIIECTSFLPKSAGWKERCTHILQNKLVPNMCKCGCGTPISIFCTFAPSHSHKDPDVKARWQKNMTKSLIDNYGEDFGKVRFAKAQNTNIKKYGVKSTFEVDSVKIKIKQSMIINHGVENCSQSDGVKQKKKDTYSKNYNAPYNASDIVNSKIRLSRHKHTFDRFNRFSDKVTPLFSLDEFNGGGYEKEYKWQCNVCNNQFLHYYHNGTIPRCTICFPKNQSSLTQSELCDYIKSIYSGEIIYNDRSIISPLEIDILLPDLKLGIEFNGLYWHAEESGKDRNYHLNKTNMMNSKNYKLIHIFEDEWVNKPNIVKSKLRNIICGNSNKIYARLCFIKELTTKEKSEFLELNHIQGNDKSSILLGLIHKDELVAVMTFGKSRFNSKYEYELIRYTTLLDHNVVGGASKLLSYFVKTYCPNSIISYADKRWTLTSDNLYTKLGFSYLHDSNPNYYYFKSLLRESRLKYQKHKLEKLLPTYKKDLSESANMTAAGFGKIWDCGNFVYVLHL